MVNIIDINISRRQGRSREGASEGGAKRKARQRRERPQVASNPECKAVSRRTETAYKAQSPGKLAQHNKAQDSGDRVNAAVVQRQFTSLSGEICPNSGVDHYGSRTEAHRESGGTATEP